MFKMAVSPKFWAPVRAEIQAEDGARINIAFKMQFNRLTVDEVKQLTDATKDDPNGDSNVDFLMRIACGWDDVTDEDGNKAEFSRAGMEWMANHGFGPAIINAFKDALPRARVKN